MYDRQFVAGGGGDYACASRGGVRGGKQRRQWVADDSVIS